MKYDEYELLELFEDEPLVMVDEQTGMFMYSKDDDHGFHLLLVMSVHKNQCSVSLGYNHFKGLIFDFELEDISEIKGKNNRLTILGNDGNREVEISFKPHFSLKTVKF
ncbi:hypothetical protein [Priestia megaterium]|uniref:Uncharacterized protein n=1 Tax=Priestia megaterium (strain DSM 319 / IMG 1521) TaxID=592022 RepID=D5DEZ9_PRIM3|nr:hypothetical protein [Priestia megaterium]ADF38672.1 conserved hypothetical protein [Priestia megaterium DSM 319]MED4216168.1 hypothetical protein [Priestia megaterium]WEZ37864.1 hypothetical protein P5636_22115 [Priestia megaterium DSM 319]